MDHLSPASLPAISIAARMASVLADGFGGRGAVTEAELLAQGYSQAELNEHLPEARRLVLLRVSGRRESPAPRGARQAAKAAQAGVRQKEFPARGEQ